MINFRFLCIAPLLVISGCFGASGSDIDAACAKIASTSGFQTEKRVSILLDLGVAPVVFGMTEDALKSLFKLNRGYYCHDVIKATIDNDAEALRDVFARAL